MKLKPAGIALGLAGNVALAWGLYNLLGIGSCGAPYPACPSSSTPYFIAVPVGIIASVLSAFIGGGPLAFFGTFAAVGVASILRGFNGGVGPEGETVFPFVFGGFFLVPVLLPVLAIPLGRRQQKRAQQLAAGGSKGVATVLAVEDTGVTVNNNPRVRLTFSVQPHDVGPAFEVQKAMTVPRVDIPRAGDRYPITYDPGNTSRFQLGPEEPRAQPAPVAAEQGWVSELGRLNDLRLAGALTDEEFVRAKEKLLSPA